MTLFRPGDPAYERSDVAYWVALDEALGDYPDRDAQWHEDVAWGRQQDRIAAAEAGIAWEDWADVPEEVRNEARGLADERTPTLAECLQEPGDEPGADAARWTPDAAADDPGMLRALLAGAARTEPSHAADSGHGLISAYLRDELDRYATAAEAASRIETRAAVRARGAQDRGDRRGSAGAREQIRTADLARRDATAEAYGIAAALQEDAFQADAEADCDTEAGG